jgi:hypothetical protein
MYFAVKVECMFVCLHVLTIKYSEITRKFNLTSDYWLYITSVAYP